MQSSITLKRKKKVYKIKNLIPGYKIHPQFAGKTLVAVPLQQIKANPNLIVEHQGERMLIPEKALYELAFKDRYGRGLYILCYYEWKPQSSLQLSLENLIGGGGA